MKGLEDDYKDIFDEHGETIVTVFSIITFLALAASVFSRTPGLSGKIWDFVGDFVIREIPGLGLSFLAPSAPGAHSVLYGAAASFSISWGIIQVFILGLRFFVNSPVSKKAEAFTDIILSVGVYYLIRSMLSGTVEISTWFSFWAFVILLIGVTLVIRGFIVLAHRVLQ